MSLDSDMAVLARVPLFGALGQDHLKLLAFSAPRRELAEGEVLFRKGARAAGAFVVTGGGIRLTAEDAPDAAGEDCGPGCLIGEMALFVDTRRPARAVAVGPTTVLSIERTLMARMLEEYPEVAASLRSRIARRLSAEIGELARVRDKLLEIDRLAAGRA